MSRPSSSASDLRRPVSELLDNPHALLTRSHLRQLGLERRAIDAVFRELPKVLLPGYSRPLVKVADYLELIERETYGNDVVHPSRRGLGG
jgi:hypothetical protein